MPDTESVTTSSSCTQCGSPLGAPDHEGMVTCANGHRAYAGYVAEATQLALRLSWLQDRIAAGDPAPDPQTARQYGVWSVGEAPLPARSAAARGPQQLLLILGAGLLVVAAVVFTAVVWQDLGAAGQVALLGVGALLVGAAAVRLARSLPSTGEALAVVAFGLAAIDAVAAPAVRLLPEHWIKASHPYQAVAALGLAVAGVVLGRRLGLRAWRWLGWLSAALAAGLASSYGSWGLAHGTEPGAALSVSVVAVAAVALLAAPSLAAPLRSDRQELVLAGVVAAMWAVVAWLAWWPGRDGTSVLGFLLTAVLTAVASGAVWWRTRLPLAATATHSLAAVAVGLALLTPGGQHSYAWAVAVAVVGVLVLAGLTRAVGIRLGLVASALVWATWVLARLTADATGANDVRVIRQLAVVASFAAVAWYVTSGLGLLRSMAWPAAAVAEVAWLATGWGRPEVPETWTIPLAVFLMVAGLLWRRAGPTDSMTWLAPAVGVALLPSAVAGWGAPWVTDLTDQSTTVGLIRLLAVLAAASLAVIVGVRKQVFGLVVPGAAALVLIAAAQVWSGLAATPRWLAIAVVGTGLLAVGARLEWLRGQGRDLRHYVSGLS